VIAQALAGMEGALDPLLTEEARKLIRQAAETLQPWVNGSADPDTVFVWSNSRDAALA
jgi:hypothetical protein